MVLTCRTFRALAYSSWASMVLTCRTFCALAYSSSSLSEPSLPWNPLARSMFLTSATFRALAMFSFSDALVCPSSSLSEPSLPWNPLARSVFLTSSTFCAMFSSGLAFGSLGFIRSDSRSASVEIWASPICSVKPSRKLEISSEAIFLPRF